jgi:hypothetical protein
MRSAAHKRKLPRPHLSRPYADIPQESYADQNKTASLGFEPRLPYRLDTVEGNRFFHQQPLDLSRQIIR